MYHFISFPSLWSSVWCDCIHRQHCIFFLFQHQCKVPWVSVVLSTFASFVLLCYASSRNGLCEWKGQNEPEASPAPLVAVWHTHLHHTWHRISHVSAEASRWPAPSLPHLLPQQSGKRSRLELNPPPKGSFILPVGSSYWMYLLGLIFSCRITP